MRRRPRAIRVLVAEPYPMTLEMICRALVAPGVEVVGRAGTARAALTAARKARPDVVLLDWSLGYRNGTGLIRRLKALPRPPKVILLGDHGDPVYQEVAATSGADGFVLKVRLIQELLPAIRSTLSR